MSIPRIDKIKSRLKTTDVHEDTELYVQTLYYPAKSNKDPNTVFLWSIIHQGKK